MLLGKLCFILEVASTSLNRLIFKAALIATNTSFASEAPISLRIRYTGSILQDASVQLSGIYPIIIIVLVAMRKSVADVLTEPAVSTFQAGTRPGFSFRSNGTRTSMHTDMRRPADASAMIIGLDEGRDRDSEKRGEPNHHEEESENGSMV